MRAFADARDVRKFVDKNNIAFIALMVSDIDGRFRTVTIPADTFSDRTVAKGIGFDASNLGYATVDDSDMLLVPDLHCGFEDPVDPEARTLSFLCDIMQTNEEGNFGQDLRHIVDKAIATLAAEGLADEMRVGVELEFNVLDELDSMMTRRETAFRIESSEIPSPPGGEENYRIASNRGYFRAEPNDHLLGIRNEIVTALKALGMQIKYHHHEVGSSQAEIEFQLTPVQFMADATTLAKHICHRIARKHGKIITFIPKLIPNEAGNGMHVHQCWFREGKNVFNAEGGLYDLSDTALAAIAGILTHADSLLALTNPTTNSYRRLIPGLEAPVKAAFAKANRSAAIRIPGYITDPEHRRFEFRTIDATCNPYLAFAAMIMASLDGARKKLDPTREGFGPFETNLYKLPPEELRKIRSFPATLEDALRGLENDNAYLQYRGVFPEALIATWIAAKQRDIDEMRRIPHPWEIARYYDL